MTTTATAIAISTASTGHTSLCGGLPDSAAIQLSTSDLPGGQGRTAASAVGEALPQPVHDRLQRRAGAEDRRHAELLELGNVVLGDDAAGEEEDVLGLLLLQ